MIDEEHWNEAQQEEVDWWGDCVNTYHEEEKQFVYARYMGLKFERDEHTPYALNMQGKEIVDLGGGPCSLVLKAKNFSKATVVDPCEYPKWVSKRYKAHGVEHVRDAAEHIEQPDIPMADEVWLYNVLQHTIDPQQIVDNGKSLLKSGGVFRVFEWVNTPVNEAHPHSLKKDLLDEWFGASGKLVSLSESGCYGLGYYGEFTY